MPVHPSLSQHLDNALGHASWTMSSTTATLNSNVNVSMSQMHTLLDLAHLIAHDCSVVAGVVTIKPRIGS